MFTHSFEKRANSLLKGKAKNPGALSAFGNEIWSSIKPTKFNIGMNALGLYDSVKTTANKMKVPLGAMRQA